MSLHDETDYARADRQDLVARLMGAQALGIFLLRAYNAFKNYGVDFQKLPEWIDQKPLDDAARLKPHAAQPKIIEYFMRLEHALTAAIRRKQMRIVGPKE